MNGYNMVHIYDLWDQQNCTKIGDQDHFQLGL
jgi:hypothetical protein